MTSQITCSYLPGVQDGRTVDGHNVHEQCLHGSYMYPECVVSMHLPRTYVVYLHSLNIICETEADPCNGIPVQSKTASLLYFISYYLYTNMAASSRKIMDVRENTSFLVS